MKFRRFVSVFLAVVSVAFFTVSFTLAAATEIPVPSVTGHILFKDENGSGKMQDLETAGILQDFDPSVIALLGTTSADYPGTYSFSPVILNPNYVFKDTLYPTGFNDDKQPAINLTYDIRFREPSLTQTRFVTRGEQIDVLDKIDDYADYLNYNAYFTVTGNKASTAGMHELTITVNPQYQHQDTAVFEHGAKSVTLKYEIIIEASDNPQTGDTNPALWIAVLLLVFSFVLFLVFRKRIHKT